MSSSSSSNDNGLVSMATNTLIPFMLRVGTVVVGLVAILVGFLYVKQDNLLYFPEMAGSIPRHPSQNPKKYRSPKEHDIPFETHMISCSDGIKIHSWLLLQPLSRNVPTIIFFHGNAGNIGLRIPNAIHMYNQLRCNILLVEYRGYGDSDTVQPNEAGLKLDAEASLLFLQNRSNSIDPNRIFVFGRSLGGAVAFHLGQYAQRKSLPLAGIIVENTFLSISKMVDTLMPYVAPFKSLVLRIGWNSYQIAPTIPYPILYLAGARDQLVPHSHMKELYHLSKNGACICPRIHIIENGTHNETWLQGGRLYWHKILSFLSEAEKISKQHDYSFSHSMATSMETVALEGSGEDKNNLQVNMGGGSDGASGSSSIPTIPNNLMGIASQAMKVNKKPSSKENKDKKAQ